MKSVGRSVLLAAVSAIAGMPILAQAGGGGPSLGSDAVPLSRTIHDRDLVKEDMDSARYRLGPIRILPSFSVPNAGYDSNVFGQAGGDPVGDWTATVSAGARLLVPFGSKFVLRADAFPRYTWYRELTDRNKFGGVYNGSLYGFFNRLTTEFAGSYSQRYLRYSSEVDSEAFTTATAGAAKFDLEISPHWSLFGRGDYARVRYEQILGPPNESAQLNNRTDSAGHGGIRYHISPEWSVGAAAEGTWADFEITPELRNNRSTAYLMSVAYNRPRLFVNLVGGYREGRGESGDFFPDYSTGVGSFFLSFFPISRIEIQAYGQRSVAYSVTALNPYYFESRIGGKINFQVATRILLNGFGLVGPNNYPKPEPADGGQLVKRRDESTLYGGGFSVLVVRPIVLTGYIARTIVDSNVPGASRDYTRYTIMLSFSGVLQR